MHKQKSYKCLKIVCQPTMWPREDKYHKRKQKKITKHEGKCLTFKVSSGGID